MSHLLVTHRPALEQFTQDGPRSFFSYFDLGLSKATDGKVSAHRVRALKKVSLGEGTGPHVHEADVQLILVLKGTALLNYAGAGLTKLVEGDLIHQPKGLRHDVVEVSDDYEHIEISLPASYETRKVDAV